MNNFKPEVNAIAIRGGICYAHGPWEGNGCPQFPACGTDPQQAKYILMAVTRHGMDLVTHLQRQRVWSERTFGPGSRAKGIMNHIRKELDELEASPTDLSEWIDIVILGFDGAWRTGATPEEIAAALAAKLAKNEARKWPDWRTMSEDQAIEHDRSEER